MQDTPEELSLLLDAAKAKAYSTACSNISNASSAPRRGALVRNFMPICVTAAFSRFATKR